MERKLATVLFVDLVGSTQLVASADPEVVRSRLTRFFDQVAHCITAHGGIVAEVRRRRRDGRVRRPVRARGRPRAGRARGARRSSRRSRSSGSRCGSGSSRARSSRTRPRRRSRPGSRSTPRRGCSRPPQPGEILLGPNVERLTRGIGRHGAARRAGGARLPGRGRGLARRLGRRGRRPAARRLGAVRRARGGARAAPQHVRARRHGTSACTSSRSTARRASASRGSRGSSSTASSARRSSPGRCLPYGEGVTYWADRRDGEGRGRDHRRRLGRRRHREAPQLLRRRGGRRSARARVGRARRGRRRAVGRPRSPGPRRPGRRSSPTCSRSCSCSRTSTGPRSRCST